MWFRPLLLISISFLMLLTHVCLSCCNIHQFYFGKLLRRKAICMDCSSFSGKGRVECLSFWGGSKTRVCKCWQQEGKKSSLIRFLLLFGAVEAYYSTKECKHANSIDQTTGGRWQPINYACWSYLGCPEWKKNLWQCADSDVKWHPDPVADAAGLGWGLRGPRSFSFDGKQLSYPIMHYYDSYLPSLPCPIQAGWKTSGHHGNSAEICSYTLKEWDSRVTFECDDNNSPHSGGCLAKFSWVMTKIIYKHISASVYYSCTWTHIRWSASPWQQALWIPQPQGQTCSLSGTASPTPSVALRDRRRTAGKQFDLVWT